MDELSVLRTFRTQTVAADRRERGRALAILQRRIHAEAHSSTLPLRGRVRLTTGRRLALALLAAAAIAVPAVALAGPIGQLLGISNPGTVVSSNALPGYELSALQTIGFPAQGMKLLGEREATRFYVATDANGARCFAIGASARTSIDALSCGAALGSFPSSANPIADFSTIDATAGQPLFLTGVAGFATDNVAQVAIVDPTGRTIVSVPVSDNLYADANPPHTAAAAIVALDAKGSILFQKPLSAPAQPQPLTP